jgi:hypothetical protein
MEPETLDALHTLLYHAEATALPEPSEMAHLLAQRRREPLTHAESAWLAQLSEALGHAEICWQHGFIAGQVAYTDACTEPLWPRAAEIAAWFERDRCGYSLEDFERRWYAAGWLAGWRDQEC